MKKYLSISLLLITFFFLSGCGGSSNVEVTGRVTLKGQNFQNIRGGGVTFVPKTGKPFYGELQPDGTFQVKASDNKKGIPPGEYQLAVRVQSQEFEGSNKNNDAQPKLLSPKKYLDIKTSGLTQTIPAGGIKDLVINLE